METSQYTISFAPGTGMWSVERYLIGAASVLALAVALITAVYAPDIVDGARQCKESREGWPPGCNIVLAVGLAIACTPFLLVKLGPWLLPLSRNMAGIHHDDTDLVLDELGSRLALVALGAGVGLGLLMRMYWVGTWAQVLALAVIELVVGVACACFLWLRDAVALESANNAMVTRFVTGSAHAHAS